MPILGYLPERVVTMEKLLAEYKKLSTKKVTKDERDFYNDTIERYQSSLELVRNFEAEFEVELSRIKAAIAALRTNDIEELRNAYTKFILTDTSFSVKNIGMMLYDFDGVIQSMYVANETHFLDDSEI